MPLEPRRNAIAFIAVTVLLDVIGFGLIMPVLPALLVQLTGDTVSRAAIDGGWLYFTYAITQFVCAPILGNLSDRFGRRPVLLYAVGSLGIDYIVMGLAPSLGWLFLGRTIAGMAGASFTPAYAYIADVTPPEKRAQSFGIIGACFGVGFIIGPAIGGVLGGLGPRAPFFAAAALSLANFAYGVFVLPESLPPERRRPFHWKRANPIGTIAHVRRYPTVLRLLSGLFLWMVGHQAMASTWSFYTKFRFGWSEAMIGASLATSGLVVATSQATLLRLVVPRIGPRRAVLTGIGMVTLGYAGFASATAGWMMFAWLPTWFFGAMVMPTTNGFLSNSVAPDAQGELQGAVASLFSLSSIVGPPLMTQLFGRFSAASSPVQLPGAAFYAAAILTTISFLIFFASMRPVATPVAATSAHAAPAEGATGS